jgi:hypothetical protein
VGEKCTHTLLVLFTQSQGDPFDVYAKSNNTIALWKYAVTLSGSGQPCGLLGSNDASNEEFVGSLSVLFNKQPTIQTSPQTVKEVQKKLSIKEVPFPIPSHFTKEVEKDRDFDICKVQLNPLVIFLHTDQGFISANVGRFTPFASPLANSRSMHKEQVEKICGQIMEGERVVASEDFAIVPFVVETQPPDTAASGELLEYRCTLDRDTTGQNIVKAKRANIVTSKALTGIIKNVSAPNHGFLQPGPLETYSYLWIPFIFCFQRFGELPWFLTKKQQQLS